MGLNTLEVDFIFSIKEKIRNAQYDALKEVNVKLIHLYWEIGKSVAEKQSENWGKSIVSKLSKELQSEFPGIGGFSTTNIWYMVQFYIDYQSDTNLQPLVGEIAWSKHIVILSKCKNSQERQFYILATRKHRWTKNVLVHQIENRTFEKYLLNQTNFDKVLPDETSKQALKVIKDDYTFDFLNLTNEHTERELEQALVKNIRQFLLEMGSDYAFIGNQYHIQVNAKDYWVDLLLYHRKLQCLIAIDLKIGDFEPEHKGKMEFYLAVLNDTVKLPHENESIGIIICKSKDRTIVEYSLKNSSQPIGIATYNTSNRLPKMYESMLPSAAVIAQKLFEFSK